jgi:cell division protein FtsI (penicillin-binding protein 3)
MKRMQAAPLSTWRFHAVVAVLCCLLLMLVWRVLSLQILNLEHGYEFLQDQGEQRSVRIAEIPAYRGVITDRRGEPLAVSTPVVSIWANPRLLKDSPRLDELAQALGMPLSELKEKLARYDGKQFMYLLRQQVPAHAREILDKKFDGVFGEREYQRFYPAGEVAAQLVGFTNVDGQGIAGVELEYNNWLQGTPGKKKYIKDLHGEVVRDIGVLKPAQSGKNMMLSIDLRLQYSQQRELQRQVTALHAASGSAVTLDVRTGEVLAMVNYPVYNPNAQKVGNPDAMRNRAITDMYEPGSTMKALTMVAALESGRFTPDTIIDTNPGRIRVGPKVFPDPVNYGICTLTRVLQKSSQVGVTKIALNLGYEPILEVFQRFGIGKAPGTGFPGESAGILPSHTVWYATDRVTLAFGYGVTATPLQIASAYSVFANHGVQMPVSLLALKGEVPAGKQIISRQVADQLLAMLHTVTADEGTAKKARVPGYEVGGKTGTARIMGRNGYQENNYVALFTGIAPIDDPRIVTIVVINDPKGPNNHGGTAAAPAFSEMTRDTLRILHVPPSATATADKAKKGTATVGEAAKPAPRGTT